MNNVWDERFLALADHISSWSKDPSTKNGCVIVGPDKEIRSTGFNGFPRGVEDTYDRLHDREQKYPLIVHAEENATMHAARIGVSIKGCTSYCTWSPCIRCAVSMIQAGLTEVVSPEVVVPDRWKDDFEHAKMILLEAGVVFRQVLIKSV